MMVRGFIQGITSIDITDILLMLVIGIVFALLVFAVILILDSANFIDTDLVAEELTEFQRRDAIVQECIRSDQYNREECILLAGQK